MDRLVEPYSEIGPLQTVLVHRPDVEITQIMPDFFDHVHVVPLFSLHSALLVTVFTTDCRCCLSCTG